MASLAGTLGTTGAYLATAIIALCAFLPAPFAVRRKRVPGTNMVRFRTPGR